MKIIAHIDRADDEMIEGWIFSPDQPDKRFTLQVFTGATLIGEMAADMFRPDLKDAGLGDGQCAFRFQLPGLLPRAVLMNIRLRVADSSVWLLPEADTVRGVLAEPEAEEGAVKTGTSRTGTSRTGTSKTGTSKFGSLWIDRPDWIDRLAEKHRHGEITGEMSTAIFRFVRDGFLVIRNAVPSAMVNALNDDIERVWSEPPEGLLIETFEPDDVMKYVAPDLAFREGRTKLLDLYAYSKPAQQAIAAPNVTSFLAAIFGETPKAFQSLTLWSGSQHPMQKDTAYVKVESNPLALVGAWMALEDVKAGNGELEYYTGSHRAPDFLFGGISKWMESFTADNERFLQSLHEDAVTYGYTKGSFLAKKGDVMLWHADLAHGDAPVAAANTATRRSMLIHFTGAGEQPFYRRGEQRAELDSGSCLFVSQYADVR